MPTKFGVGTIMRLYNLAAEHAKAFDVLLR